MVASAISGVQGLSGGVWAQLQQQQVERVAVQAEQRARVLRVQASQAQSVADRAQRNAQSMKIQSAQAQGEASNARLEVASMKSMGVAQSQLGELHAQLTSLLGAEGVLSVKASPASTAQPVLNAEGQTTGALLSVTA